MVVNPDVRVMMPQLLDVYHGDPLMAPAFVDMVCWAIGEPDIRTQYETDTGAVLPAPARTPLDRMIDESTGVTDAYVMGFAGWAYENLWGEVEDDG